MGYKVSKKTFDALARAIHKVECELVDKYGENDEKGPPPGDCEVEQDRYALEMLLQNIKWIEFHQKERK